MVIKVVSKFGKLTMFPCSPQHNLTLLVKYWYWYDNTAQSASTRLLLDTASLNTQQSA